MIAHLRHGDIDKAAWDALLGRAANRIWYAQSWVLDEVCPGWEALVDEAAGAIMPLTCRRKWGISYLFQPLGIQQLGVFSPAPSAALHARFLAAIPSRFRYIDIRLNEAMAGLGPEAGLHAHANQVIRANVPIVDLRARYAKGHRRNLKGPPPDLEQAPPTPEVFERLFRATTGRRHGASAVKGLDGLMRAVARGMERGQCATMGAVAGGELVAALCYASWEGRAILLKSANAARGHEARAMFHLYDAWIGRHAGTGMLLDLAGSDNPGTARFNAGFGAEAKAYFRLRRNLLPHPLRWIKR